MLSDLLSVGSTACLQSVDPYLIELSTYQNFLNSNFLMTIYFKSLRRYISRKSYWGNTNYSVTFAFQKKIKFVPFLWWNVWILSVVYQTVSVGTKAILKHLVLFHYGVVWRVNVLFNRGLTTVYLLIWLQQKY